MWDTNVLIISHMEAEQEEMTRKSKSDTLENNTSGNGIENANQLESEETTETFEETEEKVVDDVIDITMAEAVVD